MAFTASWIYQIVDKYSAPMAKIRKATQRAQKATKKMQKSVGKFGASMTSAQSGIVSFAGVLGGSLMLKTFINFESTMNKVQGVTLATNEEFTLLRNKAKELGETTRFSATQAASGIEMLGRNGLRTSQIMDGAIVATLKLSAATGADLSNSANIATDVMMNFNKTASELGNIVDKIAGVTINSKFSIDDYRLALGQAGGVAGSVGVSLRDFNTTIAAISPLFKSGAGSGTAYKTFLQRLVPQSKEAASMMKRLNLNFFDSNGQMKDMGDISEQLKNSFSKLNEKQRTQAATTIFGTDSMRAAFGLAKFGAVKFEKLAKSIDKVSATKLAEDRMRGLSGVMLILASTWEAVQIALFDSGLDLILIKIFKGITSVMRGIASANPIILQMVGIMGMLAIVAGPVLMTLGFMATGVSALMGLFGGLSLAVMASAAPFVAIAIGIGLLVALVVKAFTANSKLRDSFVGIFTALAPILAPLKMIWDMLGGMEGLVTVLSVGFNILAQVIGGVLTMAILAITAPLRLIIGLIEMLAVGAAMIFGGSGGVASGGANSQQNTLSGRIDVVGSGGAQVKSAEMDTDMGGDLGFNMGGF